MEIRETLSNLKQTIADKLVDLKGRFLGRHKSYKVDKAQNSGTHLSQKTGGSLSDHPPLKTRSVTPREPNNLHLANTAGVKNTESASAPTRWQVIEGDITELPQEYQVDAIVNAANQDLAKGQGVCGAIFKKAGAKLETACKKATRNKSIEVGSALATKAYGLKQKSGIKTIIHAVAPNANYIKDRTELESKLGTTYENLMETATKKKCKRLAIPIIGTGIFKIPFDTAAKVAVEKVQEYQGKNKSAPDVIFVVYQHDNNKDEMLASFKEKLPQKK